MRQTQHAPLGSTAAAPAAGPSNVIDLDKFKAPPAPAQPVAPGNPNAPQTTGFAPGSLEAVAAEAGISFKPPTTAPVAAQPPAPQYPPQYAPQYAPQRDPGFAEISRKIDQIANVAQAAAPAQPTEPMFNVDVSELNLTETEEAALGSANGLVQKIAAHFAAKSDATLAQQIEDRFRKVEAAQQGIQQNAAQSRVDAFEQQLQVQIPGLNQILGDPGFQQRLSALNPSTGRTHYDDLSLAYANRNLASASTIIGNLRGAPQQAPSAAPQYAPAAPQYAPAQAQYHQPAAAPYNPPAPQMAAPGGYPAFGQTSPVPAAPAPAQENLDFGAFQESTRAYMAGEMSKEKYEAIADMYEHAQLSGRVQGAAPQARHFV